MKKKRVVFNFKNLPDKIETSGNTPPARPWNWVRVKTKNGTVHVPDVSSFYGRIAAALGVCLLLCGCSSPDSTAKKVERKHTSEVDQIMEVWAAQDQRDPHKAGVVSCAWGEYNIARMQLKTERAKFKRGEISKLQLDQAGGILKMKKDALLTAVGKGK